MDLINEVIMLLNATEIRDEETSGPVDHKMISRNIVGQNYNLSGSSAARLGEMTKFITQTNQGIGQSFI